MAQQRKAYKDYFDRSAACALAAQVALAWPDFAQRKFVQQATRGLQDMEFHQRVQHFSDSLRHCLPAHVPDALAVLTRSLPEPLVDCEAVTDGWLQWPIGQFIADHGGPHFDESMHAMTELTQRFSAEFAIRPFLQNDQKRTIGALKKLLKHPSPHVRRWCSEGVRSRLPWGARLHALVADPAPIWPILDALIDDPELYVRRSVANNLNDIAKDHPQAVIQRCSAWWPTAGVERQWLIRQGLRTLVKNANPDALALIGYAPVKKLSAEVVATPGRIKMGGTLKLQATLHSAAAQRQSLMVDYIVHYVRKTPRSGGKVFKWKSLTIDGGQTQQLEKSQSMRETTVRALYPGEHKVELQVNGEILASAEFNLYR